MGERKYCLNKINTFSNIHFFKFIIYFTPRHLHYTGHIGDFVIASEDAIAKGIRRIVALTGPEATKSLRTTRILEKQLSQLQVTIETDKSETNSKEYVKKIIELTEEISHALIPAWWKVIFNKIIFNKIFISAGSNCCKNNLSFCLIG